jgi:hemin uptake protein HemP
MTKTSPEPGDHPEKTEAAAPVLSSRDLLAGHREVIIEHGAERYRLRLTSSNKLILVK